MPNVGWMRHADAIPAGGKDKFAFAFAFVILAWIADEPRVSRESELDDPRNFARMAESQPMNPDECPAALTTLVLSRVCMVVLSRSNKCKQPSLGASALPAYAQHRSNRGAIRVAQKWVNFQLVPTTQRRRLGGVSHANLVCAKEPGGNHKTRVIGDLICVDGNLEIVMLPLSKHSLWRRQGIGDSTALPEVVWEQYCAAAVNFAAVTVRLPEEDSLDHRPFAQVCHGECQRRSFGKKPSAGRRRQ